MPRRLLTPTITNLSDLQEMVDFYMEQDAFAFDVETDSLAINNRVSWVAFATHGRVDVLPLGHPHGELLLPERSEREAFYDESKVGKSGKLLKQWRTVRHPAVYSEAPRQLRPSEAWRVLTPLFMSPDITKVGHNLKFDLKSVTKYLPDLPPRPYVDTMGVQHLLDETKLKGLKALTREYYGVTYDTAKTGANIDTAPFSEVATYAHCDAYFTWLLYRDLFPKLEEEDLLDLFDMEMELMEVVARMELFGAPVDLSALDTLRTSLSKEFDEVQKRIFKAAGKVFNLNSTMQKAEFIYDDLGIECEDWAPKGGRSVKGETMEKLAAMYPQFPVLHDLTEYGRLQKLVTSYVGNSVQEGGLAEHILDGRIHADFGQFNTKTGRFSCRSPNLQNIPRRGELGSLIRALFVPTPGHSLVVADYSQIEYRVLAHYCEDESLVRAFMEGIDPHQMTAALLFGVEPDDVTKEQRDIGKTFNFAQIYGAGDTRLAATAGISIQQVRLLKKTYAERFPRIMAWKGHVVRTAKKRRKPYVQTLLKRRRWLPALHFKDDERRMSAERMAVNTVVQGSAADIMKLAMVDIARNKKPEWQQILTIHDEVVVMVPEEDAEEATAYVQETMESVDLIDIPLIAEAKHGKSWEEAK